MPKPTGTTSYLPRAQSFAMLSPENSAEAYDTLAELFLGEVGSARAGGGGGGGGGGGAVAAPAAAEHAADEGRKVAGGVGAEPVECLILGHLPVLGSAWVSQYARCIAEEEDVTVALVQVRAGYATVEIVVSDDEQAAQPPQARASLEAAIDAAAAVAGRWILRVEGPDEPVIAAHPRVSSLTLLTSADEIASVAAYRTLKRLLGTGEEGDEDDGRPEVRVSVMGAPEDAADAVFAKLAEATRMFIHRPIERAPGVHRVTPTAASLLLFSGPVDEGAQRVMAAIARPRRRMRLTDRDEPRNESAPETRTGRGSAAAAAVVEAPVVVDTAAALASHLAGLTPLEIACPYAPEVQFAVDGGGGLHVLAWHEAGGGAGLEPLTVAAAWAVSHRSLLGAVVRGLGASGDSGGGPVMHMFVGEPREVRRLLDAEIRVHLLAPVNVAGRTGWLCRDLN